ncbi:nuclear transport factor 2 family protein [Lihuaxuella thermophila]|uniref:SnoaL-like domain-containing protein n=1 Tax=Lihuaxuella thermophila TaxID=1173111 RepID=A0A1H8H4A3_9BACL|nr:nuclear transport factor 2 family protein [Lihuaxuella thermophila]SEN51221.1 SnoaL-like domain-containing protein [Lihuaxuella thermophila]
MGSINPEYTDLQITCAEDCGNAPKKKVLKEFNIAFVQRDIGFITEHIADNLLWNLAGSKQIQGKDRFVDALQQMMVHRATELSISNIITHGNTGSVNGVFKMENKREFAFCHVYRFSSAGKNAKVKEITSYIIEVS